MNAMTIPIEGREPSRQTPVRHRGGMQTVCGASAVVAAVAMFAWLMPSWAAMWAIAATEFLALKALTLEGASALATRGKITAYLTLWPGMNTASFLHGRLEPGSRPAVAELVAAMAKLALGLAAMGWTAAHAMHGEPLLVAWIGMFGLIFALHFGALHLVSWLWRRVGVVAPPIMRAPIAATSLTSLWSERWNVAFAEAARRLLFRPLARRYGARVAGASIFLVSGLVHETVISLPARGGWGGPTLYFLLQAAGIAVEKSTTGVRVGLGRGVRGWLWAFFIAAAPLPLLFHAAFARNVIVPFYRTLGAFLP